MVDHIKTQNEESKQAKVKKIQEMHENFVVAQLSLKDLKIDAIEEQLRKI